MIRQLPRACCRGPGGAFALVALLAQEAQAQPTPATSRDRGAEHDAHDAGTWLGRPNPLRAFLPSAAARAAEQQARSEALLARRLALLPGVHAAQVRLVLPDLERAALDRPAAPARAQVLLRADAASEPSHDEIARVLSDALPELAPIELSLTRTPAARPRASAAEPSVRVGPFWVAPASALPLRIALAVCLLSNIVLASLLLLRRRQR